MLDSLRRFDMRSLYIRVFLLLSLTTVACTIREVNINDSRLPQDAGTGRNNTLSGGNCSINDGIHPAQIDYHNAVSGRIYTSHADVEVDGCRVIRIYFPQHRLDESNMAASPLNRMGEAYVTDHDGRNYTVYIRDTGVINTQTPQVPHTSSSRGCSGDAYCNVCKNCKYCKHCAKEGGTCGICR